MTNRFRLAAAVGISVLGTTALLAQQLQYPVAKKGDQVDVYHGTKVADPYRWMEDDMSAQTAAWVEAENKVTFPYLEAIPFRAQLQARVKEVSNYAKYSSPSRKGPYYFFSKNDGLQDQSVLYIQKGLEGTPEVLIDPNQWEGAGTTRLGTFVPSMDAKYAVYGISKSGSDWQQYKVMELATKKTLPDTLDWVKVSSIAWHGGGFYYSRYPAPGKGKSEKAAINEDHRVYFHKIGTPQMQDRQIYQDAANPQRFNTVETTDDERFALLTVSDRGKGKDGNALFARDLSRGQREFNPVVKTIGNESYGVVDNIGENLLVETNKNAANGRVVLVDPRKPDEANWKVILPEKPEPLQGVSTAGGKLFATYLKDVTTRAYGYSLDGTLENEVELPGPGNAGGFGGNKDDTFVFYTFNSLNVPPTIYRYDIATKKSTIFRQPQVPGYNPDLYETRAVSYPSKDGTKIPMFLVHKKGLKLDGTNPTLLYAYGGLRVGAVINQRPDLAKLASPQVGGMDMLRFHKFTIGFNWIAEYGSSDDAEEFKALYAYSPLHNIKAGVKYPTTLITTADHDDRVVPAHSFKYAATLQEKAGKDTPILIRIDTKSGHGASSLTKSLETTADIYTFIMHNMGLKPAVSGTKH